jgi:hypothetical protein
LKCDAKKCNNEESKDLITLGETKIHRACMTTHNWLQKTGELWLKFYNNKESWNVMMRSLGNWNEKHDPEYMCFCLSKAIKDKTPVYQFHSIYYLLNSKPHMMAYESYKNPKQIDNVIIGELYFSKEEYNELQKLMNYNEIKLEWYIKRLSDYMKTTGKDYDSHYRTIIDWYNKDELRKPAPMKSNII